MSKVSHFFLYLRKDPYKILDIFTVSLSRFISSDKLYLQLLFFARMHKKLNLENPKSFNEKIQWLKLYDRNPKYTDLVDKYKVKHIVASIIGEEHIIPTLGVWDVLREEDINGLPNSFVLKCTHDSGGVLIVKDKSDLKKEDIRNLNKNLAVDFYSQTREWPYKKVHRRIIAEEFIKDSKGQLNDFKFFCFNGKVKVFKIDFDRQINHRANYYNRNGELLPFGEKHFPPNPQRILSIPQNLEEMICFAEQLSQGLTFVRVDFYNVDGMIYFGEMTFYPASGVGPFTDEIWDNKLGEWITLPRKEVGRE